MKNYIKEIGIGVLLICLAGGFVFYFSRHEPDAWLKIGVIVLAMTVGFAFYIKQLIRRRKDVTAGVPADDEFTMKAKIFAGSRAFLGSM